MNILPPPLKSRRSPSLAHFALAAVLVINGESAIAEGKPNPWAENFSDNVIKSMVEITKNAVSSKNINNIGNSINKNVFQQEGTAKIEIGDGNLKIDTKNNESIRLAAEFRKNYKKSEKCKEPETEEIRTQCVNIYIRARKAAMQ